MKNAVAKKNQNPRLITITPWADEADTATKINHLDRVVQECGRTSKQAAIMCGWLLQIEKASRQGTFLAWAEANLDISQRTVYNYMDLFTKAIAAQQNDFQLECSEKTRQKMVEEYADSVESKTLTDLYCDLGIVTRTKSNLGGKREGAGRKRKDSLAETAAAAAEAADAPEFAVHAVGDAAANLFKFGVSGGGYDAMSAAELANHLTFLKDVVRRAEDTLAAKRKKH